MNKLVKKGASSALSHRADKVFNDKKKKITTVSDKINTTYKVPPLSLRLSISDKKDIADWVADLQKDTPRKVSPAKLFRALYAIKDDIDENKIIEQINLMN